MGLVRFVTPYTTTSPSTSHTYYYGSASGGNRIVLFVQSYAGVSSISGGFTEHEWATNTLGIRMLSKISYGGDSSVTVNTTDATDRIFIWAYELDDAEVYYGSASAKEGVSSAYWSESGLPDGCVALMGVSMYIAGTDNTGVSWPSDFTHKGYTYRDWSDGGGSKRVWGATAVDEYVSGSISVSKQLISNQPIGTSYAWAGGVWGPNPDNTPPTDPTNLRLTAMTPTSVTVTWDASTDSGSGLSGYTFYLNGVAKGSTSSRSATFSGLTSGVSVTIQVDAYDAKGNRSAKAELVVTPINDTTPPIVPQVRVTALDAGKITVGWDTPYDESSVVGYGVYLNGAKQGADQTARTKAFTGLSAGALYTISVDAIDLLGNRSARGTRTVRAQADRTPPTLPGSVSVVATSKTAITLAWNPSSDDNVGVTGYGLYLGSLRVAEIPSRVYTFTGLTPGVSYTVGVDAVDELGNRSNRVMQSATTLEDTSGDAPPYEYVLYDWDTHLPLDSLPLQNVSFEITLNGGGQLTADIPLYDSAYTVGRIAAATRPERTMILVYRGEQLVWGGRIVDPQDYDSDSGVLKITAEECIAIYGKRYVAFTGPRPGTVPHTEVTWLLEHAASPADLRWLTQDGVAGTGTVDREYRADDFVRILDAVADVAAAPGGFDWWVQPSWDAVNDRPRFVLRRVSRTSPPDTGLTLEYPGNVRGFSRSTRRGLATRTWGQLRRPDGGVMLASVTRNDLLSDGWPLIEEAWQFDGLTSQAALDAETQRASDASAGAKQVFEFVLAITPDVRWWQWELGGQARVVITDHIYPAQPDGAPGLDRPMKIVSLKVQPDSNEGELVTVTTGEHTVAVD
ncbi:hypothetical protein GCM10010404_82040 [Nonomuraea africana]|uniref:Chitodextrinase n=1 Tax=Nonomuraea africana TaxID=46171 RepID=A0ABR9KXR2_9ACTN|nr:fibronectin type III domain-containing protein [Nonomuraea africana]MBE1566561.1 chitodextrinase [Nonomuraea africana]